MEINWNPNGWNQSERNQLLNFWTNRYASNPIKMSPQEHRGDGGTELGFFDSVAVMKQLQTKYPGDYYRQMDQFMVARYERKEDWNKAYQLNREGPDRDRMLKLQQTEQAGENLVLDRDTKNFEENHAAYQERMGELISYDAKHQHPIANPDRDLQKDPPTVDERYQWLNRDNRQKSQRTGAGQQTENQQLENQREEAGQYKNGLFFADKKPEQQNRDQFAPAALEKKVEQRIETERSTVMNQATAKTHEMAKPEPIKADPKTYFIQRAPSLEEIGKKLDREETSKEREGRGQMQQTQKAFTEKEQAGRADFSPKAEHEAWAQKVALADRANTEKMQSPKLRTQEDLKTNPMAREKAVLAEKFKQEPIQERTPGRLDQMPQMNKAKEQEAEKPVGLSKAPPQMRSLSEVAANTQSGKSVESKAPPTMRSLVEVGAQIESRRAVEAKAPPQMRSLSEVAARTQSGKSVEAKAPPQMNPKIEAADRTQSGKSVEAKAPPQMNPARTSNEEKKPDVSAKAPPQMNPVRSTETTQPTRSVPQRSIGYER